MKIKYIPQEDLGIKSQVCLISTAKVTKQKIIPVLLLSDFEKAKKKLLIKWFKKKAELERLSQEAEPCQALELKAVALYIGDFLKDVECFEVTK